MKAGAGGAKHAGCSASGFFRNGEWNASAKCETKMRITRIKHGGEISASMKLQGGMEALPLFLGRAAAK